MFIMSSLEKLYIPPPITAIDYKLIRKTNDEWLKEKLAWNNEQGCSHTKCFVTHANPSMTIDYANIQHVQGTLPWDSSLDTAR